jgi:hypothetical protein
MPTVTGSLEPLYKALLVLLREAVRIFDVIFAPWPSTYEPIKSLLNAASEAEKDDLTAAWRNRKLSELSFVGITVSPGSSPSAINPD